MEVQVRTRGIAPEEIPNEEIERRIRFAVDRFEPRISEVTVQLQDVNGPRGGVDKICILSATMSSGGQVHVSDKRRKLLSAVNGAARRLTKRVSELFEIRRTRDTVRDPRLPAA